MQPRLRAVVGALAVAAAIAALAHAGPINRQAGGQNNLRLDTRNQSYTEQNVCVNDDVLYQAGDAMPAPTPCARCVCAPPGARCTPVACDKRPGCKALQRPNQCCPEYQCECERNGRVYQNGERLDSADKPCEACYCRGGEVVCTAVECYRRDDCEPQLVPGRCCPKYDHCPPLVMDDARPPPPQSRASFQPRAGTDEDDNDDDDDQALGASTVQERVHLPDAPAAAPADAQTATPEIAPVVPEIAPVVPEIASATPEIVPAAPEERSPAPEAVTDTPEAAPDGPEGTPATPEIAPAAASVDPQAAPAEPEATTSSADVATTTIRPEDSQPEEIKIDVPAKPWPGTDAPADATTEGTEGSGGEDATTLRADAAALEGSGAAEATTEGEDDAEPLLRAATEAPAADDEGTTAAFENTALPEEMSTTEAPATAATQGGKERGVATPAPTDVSTEALLEATSLSSSESSTDGSPEFKDFDEWAGVKASPEFLRDSASSASSSSGAKHGSDESTSQGLATSVDEETVKGPDGASSGDSTTESGDSGEGPAKAAEDDGPPVLLIGDDLANHQMDIVVATAPTDAPPAERDEATTAGAERATEAPLAGDEAQGAAPADIMLSDEPLPGQAPGTGEQTLDGGVKPEEAATRAQAEQDDLTTPADDSATAGPAELKDGDLRTEAPERESTTNTARDDATTPREDDGVGERFDGVEEAATTQGTEAPEDATTTEQPRADVKDFADDDLLLGDQPQSAGLALRTSPLDEERAKEEEKREKEKNNVEKVKEEVEKAKGAEKEEDVAEENSTEAGEVKGDLKEDSTENAGKVEDEVTERLKDEVTENAEAVTGKDDTVTEREEKVTETEKPVTERDETTTEKQEAENEKLVETKAEETTTEVLVEREEKPEPIGLNVPNTRIGNADDEDEKGETTVRPEDAITGGVEGTERNTEQPADLQEGSAPAATTAAVLRDDAETEATTEGAPAAAEAQLTEAKINPEVLQLKPSPAPANGTEGAALEADATTPPPQWLKADNDTSAGTKGGAEGGAEGVKGAEEGAQGSHDGADPGGAPVLARAEDGGGDGDVDKKDLFILEDFFTKLYRHQIATDATKH